MRGRKQTDTEPMMMIHHVREIQMRLLSVVAVLIVGMVVGYLFYEPLFEFIKAPLHGSLHYMSPSGSFTFIVKICLMVGVVAALPVAVYNAIMFIQPALAKRLSRARVYVTTFASLLLAATGAGFGFLLIIPLALHFFYGFQIDGLVAIISADEYLRFVMGIVITFALLFQLPLLMCLADHIRPLPPRKLFKFEKYVVLGSIVIAVIVPFANDLTVQTLVASPVIVLYNVSIGLVVLQQLIRKQRNKKQTQRQKAAVRTQERSPQIQELPKKQFAPQSPVVAASVSPRPAAHVASPAALKPMSASASYKRPVRSLDGTLRTRAPMPIRPQPRPTATRVISDIRRPSMPPTRLTNKPSLADDNLQ